MLLIDAGILGEPLTETDVTRQAVAAAAGVDVQELADARDRTTAIATMGRGAAEVVRRLHAEGRLDAIGALGGSGGTALATHAMRALPVGVPKLMVSTVASGETSPYVGSVDVTMMYSVVDVAGINRISTRIIANAARALAGMATGTESLPGEEKPLIVASMWGVTTPCVTTARERLEELGYDVLVFHQTGTGGKSMEELIATGLVDGVLDVTTTELADELGGGIWPSGPERLETAGRLGIPQVVSLGALDVIVISSTGLPEPLPDRFCGRPIYLHDEILAATRATPEECAGARGGGRAQAECGHGADRAVRAAAWPLAALARRARCFHDRGGGRGAVLDPARARRPVARRGARGRRRHQRPGVRARDGGASARARGRVTACPRR